MIPFMNMERKELRIRCACGTLAALRSTSTIRTVATKKQHRSAQKRTREEGQKWKDRIRIRFSCRDEEAEDTGNTEENEECFP